MNSLIPLISNFSYSKFTPFLYPHTRQLKTPNAGKNVSKTQIKSPEQHDIKLMQIFSPKFTVGIV